MRQQQIERMKELVELLKEAAYIYEQENRELMSNLEYDKLYDELVKLEEETGVVLAGSVTQKVGYEVMSSLPKVTHTTRMLSLDKTKEVSKLESFLGIHHGLLSWKLDGLTIVCTYEEGKLLQAITRGNGEVGEDVTSNAKVFKNLPLTIPTKERVVIRGEAVIRYSDFEKINEKLPEEEKYKNPRNLCSGSVRQLDSSITAKRNIRFYAFSIVEGKESFTHKKEQLEWMASEGFEVVEYKEVTKADVAEAVEFFKEQIATNDFASDGLVLTYDDIAYSRSLGVTAKFPKDSIAFKWQDEIKETSIVKVEWNTSRTGLINPVAVFEPVELEGTTVERASLHNLSILEELEIGVGDTVTVYKANMIIPQVAQNLTRSGTVDIPHQCDVCGGETIVRQDKSAKTLYCPNGNCPAQRTKAFVHFVSRNAMNIEGLSEATLEKLIAKEILTDVVSLYHLEPHKETIQSMEGLGEKSYTNLIASIEKSRKTTLAKVVYALGILQIGPMNAKLICDHFADDLDRMMEASVDELLSVDGIGPVIAKELHDYFHMDENKDLMGRLLKELAIEKTEKADTSNSPIKDKVFVVTGSVNHFDNRKALQARIEELGGKVTGSVSKKTDYLINNDVESTSSKNKKAKDLGVAIIDEEQFLDLIK